jgi:biotin-dependent carboxylase-like uncharacterized protein
MSLEILEPGVQCSIQDRGRSARLLEQSWAIAGAMDNLAYRLANLCVGNDPGDHLLSGDTHNGQVVENPGDAVLEITLFGTRLRFQADTVIAVTGADLSVTLNGAPLELWRAHLVKAGDILEFGMSRGGMRAYLAVAGGLDTPVFMGSRSTFTLMGFGGLGRPLATGDVLPIGEPRAPLGQLARGRIRPDRIPSYTLPAELRVVPGPQDERYTEEAVQQFFATEWKASTATSRSAIRLLGPQLTFRERSEDLALLGGADPSNIVDDPIPIGGIQTPGGAPIILHCEGPTGGGYAKIATIVSSDLWKAAQVRPMDTLRFRAVSREDSYAALAAYRTLASEDSIVLD